MATTVYSVTGMTCENCERHVREEVEQIPGVESLDVRHADGRLSVTTAGDPVSDDAIIAAVDEAGYTATRA